jgi:hypothetical protein
MSLNAEALKKNRHFNDFIRMKVDDNFRNQVLSAKREIKK